MPRALASVNGHYGAGSIVRTSAPPTLTRAASASARRSAGCARWPAEAVDTLRAALGDEHTGHRIRAAIALLDTAVKVEVDKLAQRVEALEAAEDRPAMSTRLRPRTGARRSNANE